MKNIFFATLVTLVAGLTSCCDFCSKSAPKIGELENATWTLIEFQNNPIENSTITLHFSAPDKMIYGTADCNNFFAGYTLYAADKHNIKIGNVGATRKACPDMEDELKFTAALSSVSRITLEGDRLAMIDSTDNLVAVLVCAKM